MTPDTFVPAKLLLVDDVRDKRLAIEIVLQPLNLTVVAVDSGVEALRRLLVEDFAVILLDVNMPKMDGFETAELIRKRPRSEHTPIIFLTAFPDETHVSRGYALGAVDYLLTPVVPEALIAKVSAFAELHQLNQQVQRQADQKVALAEERSARMAAEKASLAKNEFVANVSHELRTPMNAILGMTDLALMEELTPLTREYLRIVKTNAHLLLELLNEILDYSRLEAGKFVIESTPFALRELVAGVTQTMGWRAAEKQLELKCHFDPELPELIVGDPLRVRQVLMNLVGNAVKFTDQGEVALDISTRDSSEGNALVRIAISDTGIGISTEDQRRIFAPFTQADASLKRRVGGTGLGLTIASDLIRSMGGTLALESQIGSGSTFSFEILFPIYRAHQALHRAESAPASEEELSDAPYRPLQILLAEDTRANQLVVVQGLARRGHVVHVSNNGKEAVEAAAQGDFDLILMDLQMPDMDGFEATAALRASARSAQVPIIALTAHAMAGDRERCIQAGMDGYLSKPLDLTQLIELVESPRFHRGRQHPVSQAE